MIVIQETLAERPSLCVGGKEGRSGPLITQRPSRTPTSTDSLSEALLRRVPDRPRQMIDPVILNALHQAQAALTRYVQPGGPGEADTINALLRILDNEPLVRAQYAAGPQPIATAPREHERSLLLFCPEQGGWHVGQWLGVDRARWRAVNDDAIELEPTHWMPAPADPE